MKHNPNSRPEKSISRLVLPLSPFNAESASINPPNMTGWQTNSAKFRTDMKGLAKNSAAMSPAVKAILSLPSFLTTL